ncbi:hypothetical protein VUR80DRAFT_5467 [Thermomyces stellatus]
MSSQLKPILFYDGEAVGPNPPRVKIILEELGLPYETIPIPLSDVKKPEYTRINPNGRLPAIHDPNTGLTLWESGAIVLYLIERYDTSHKLSFPRGSNEAELARQWLFFQATGQGPYYGQAVWFHKYHPEDVASAKERYTKEIQRVTGVLDGWLAKQEVREGSDGPWLVGGKLSYADLAYIPWQVMARGSLGIEFYNVEEYPHVKGWMERMTARESARKAMGPHLP